MAARVPDREVAMHRSVVLVTVMSGTGKSAVLDELARRGHRVLDTDDSGWIVQVDAPGGPEPGGTCSSWRR
jgi:predicted ATPase